MEFLFQSWLLKTIFDQIHQKNKKKLVRHQRRRDDEGGGKDKEKKIKNINSTSNQ